MSSNKMRVLVTGGAGFLGSHLCDALLAEGHSVIAVDNLITGRLANIEHLKHEPRFEFRQLDICQPFDSGKVDFVYHFACPASPVDYMTHGIETLQVGSAGTFNALEVARKYGATFFLASTSECYGDPHQHPQTETYWGQRESRWSALRVRRSQALLRSRYRGLSPLSQAARRASSASSTPTARACS